MTCSPATRIRVLITIPPFCVNAREIPPGHTSCVNLRLHPRAPRKAWSGQRCGRRAPTGRPGERSPGCRLDDRHGLELSKDFEHPLSTHPKRRWTFRMFRRPHGRPQSRYGGMPRRRRIIRTRYSSTEETARQEPAPPGGRIAHAPSLRPLAGRSRLVDTGRTPGPPRTRDAGRVARPYVVAERGSTRARHPPVTRSPTPGKGPPVPVGPPVPCGFIDPSNLHGFRDVLYR